MRLARLFEADLRVWHNGLLVIHDPARHHRRSIKLRRGGQFSRGIPHRPLQFRVKMIGRRIAARMAGVIKVPKPGESILQPGEALKHVLANLHLGPAGYPDADFIHLAAEIGQVALVIVDAPCGPPQPVMVTIADSGKAAGVIIRGHQHPIEIGPHASSAGHDRQMTPLVGFGAPLGSPDQPGCGAGCPTPPV